MCTELIHLTYEGNFQLDHTANVVSCCEDEERREVVHIVLNETVFHPQVRSYNLQSRRHSFDSLNLP